MESGAVTNVRYHVASKTLHGDQRKQVAEKKR